MDNYRLEIEGLSKSFPGVKALDKIQLKVKPGTVHALVGENGAGKSTLMKCLFGLYHPDEGVIKIDGEEVIISDPKTAMLKGISMIHQELNPIPYRNVVENVWAGRFTTKGLVVNDKEMIKKTEALLQDLEFDIPLNTLAKDLSVSQLQALEIAKAISYDAKIVIMDEPTSSLTEAETEHLFKLIKRLRNEGRSIIYISHKLEEIFEIADEVTVFRDGKYIDTWNISQITIDHLIQAMVGRSMEERYPSDNHAIQSDVILKVEKIYSANPRSFQNISFDLHKGEILGIGGLVGAQRTELVESLFGLRKIASGRIFVNGKEIENKTPAEAINNGFALVTEERRTTGIFPMLSVRDNMLVAAYKKFVRNFLRVFNPKSLAEPVHQMSDSLSIKMPDADVQIQNLSGGNQQKVLVGRWLMTDCSILILDEPTRGIDVGSKYEIYKIMRDLTSDGHAVIMVSSEMPELLGMSDRILVMCEGHLSGMIDRENATDVEVMRLATQYE